MEIRDGKSKRRDIEGFRSPRPRDGRSKTQRDFENCYPIHRKAERVRVGRKIANKRKPVHGF